MKKPTKKNYITLLRSKKPRTNASRMPPLLPFAKNGSESDRRQQNIF